MSGCRTQFVTKGRYLKATKEVLKHMEQNHLNSEWWREGAWWRRRAEGGGGRADGFGGIPTLLTPSGM